MPSTAEPRERPILFSEVMSQAIRDGRKTQTRRIMINSDHYACLSGDCPHDYQSECDDSMLSFCPYGWTGDRLWIREAHYRFGHWERITGKKARTRTGRQRWGFVGDSNEVLFNAPESFRKGMHAKDPETSAWHKRLARFMPRRFCRTVLEVTDVRYQHLQEISEADAIAEGMRPQLGDGTGRGPGFKWHGIGYEGVEAGYYHTPELNRDGLCSCNAVMPSGKGSYDLITYPAICAFRERWDCINGHGSWESNPWVWAVSFKVLKGTT